MLAHAISEGEVLLFCGSIPAAVTVSWLAHVFTRRREHKGQRSEAYEMFNHRHRLTREIHRSFVGSCIDEKVAVLTRAESSPDKVYFTLMRAAFGFWKEQMRLRVLEEYTNLKQAIHKAILVFQEVRQDLLLVPFPKDPAPLPEMVSKWPENDEEVAKQLAELRENKAKNIWKEFDANIKENLDKPCKQFRGVLAAAVDRDQARRSVRLTGCWWSFYQRMRFPLGLRRIWRGSIRRGKGILACLLDSPVFVSRDELALFCREHHIHRMALVPQARAKKLAPKGHFVALVVFDRDHIPGLVGLGKMSERLCEILGVRRVFLMTEEELPPEMEAEVVRSAEVVYEGP